MTRTDFSHLSKLRVDPTRSVEFVLREITVGGKSPVLTLGPATEDNAPYYNEVLKQQGRTTGQIARLRAGKLDSSVIDAARKQDRELFPRYVMRGWKHITDSSGREVKFSVSAAASFLVQLPDYIFDMVREHAGNPQNFVDDLVMDPAAKAEN